MGASEVDQMIEDSARDQIEDLYVSLEEGSGEWGEWETDFIDDMYEKLRDKAFVPSAKQCQKIEELWEKL